MPTEPSLQAEPLLPDTARDAARIDGVAPAATPLALSRLAHDRAAHRRTDPQWLAAHWADAQLMVVTTEGLAAVTGADGSPRLLFLTGAEVDATVEGRAPEDWPGTIFLGEAAAAGSVPPPAESAGPASYGAVVVDAGAPAPAGSRFANLRDVGAAVGELEAGLFTSAVALVAFHARNGFCPRCGAPSTPAQAGWVRRCTREGVDLFPRSDPAVIMLVHDGGDRCVLGRQRVWPEGRFSVLAGFVEAGEPFEAAVVREVHEEVGISVTDVRYVASQPWPFPQSLMIGCTARATSEQIVRHDGEIAEAFWFTREQVAAAVDWDAQAAAERDGAQVPGFGPGGVLRAVPGPVSIARQLLDAWVQHRI